MYNHKNGITLRKIDRDDLDSLLLLKQESWWGTHGMNLLNSYDQIRWFENMPSNCIVLTAMMNGNFVGVCLLSDIDWISRTSNISGSIIKDQRKMDVSKKAFEAGLDFSFEMMNFRRLNAEVVEYNYPAQLIEIKHLGFKIEGIKRLNVFKAGKYYNSIVLGIFNEEWRQSDRVIGMGDSCNKNFDHKTALKMIERSKLSFDWQI